MLSILFFRRWMVVVGLILGAYGARATEWRQLRGEARLIAAWARLPHAHGEEREELLDTLSAEVTQVAFRSPLRATTSTVVDQRFGYYANVSNMVVTGQDVLILLFSSLKQQDPLRAREFLLKALDEDPPSCASATKADLTRLVRPLATLLSEPSAYDAKRSDFWDGSSVFYRCRSLACIHIVLDAVAAIEESVPRDYVATLVPAAIRRMSLLNTTERETAIAVEDETARVKRGEFLSRYASSDSYHGALWALASSAVERARCSDIWRPDPEKIPPYLDQLATLVAGPNGSEALLTPLKRGKLETRETSKYFWQGGTGRALLEELRFAVGSFRDGVEHDVLQDPEQRARIIRIVERMEDFARADWSREESVMIRSSAVRVLTPVVASDAGLLAFVAEKIDLQFAEVRGDRKLEALLLSAAGQIKRNISARKGNTQSTLSSIASKLRTPEIAWALMSTGEKP